MFKESMIKTSMMKKLKKIKKVPKKLIPKHKFLQKKTLKTKRTVKSFYQGLSSDYVYKGKRVR